MKKIKKIDDLIEELKIRARLRGNELSVTIDRLRDDRNDMVTWKMWFVMTKAGEKFDFQVEFYVNNSELLMEGLMEEGGERELLIIKKFTEALHSFKKKENPSLTQLKGS